MAKSTKDRVQKWRDHKKNKGGRNLSCWISLDAARNLDLIKELTGETNSQVIADALTDLYRSVWYRRASELITVIQEQISQGAKRQDLTRLYRDMIKLLRYDYSSAKSIKTALNQMAVPNYSDKTGAWKVDQVRRLMR